MAVPLTPARSGLLRSAQGRSGYPIVAGAVLRFYAQSGVMRSGAGRSNYHSGKVFVSIGGVQVGTGRADKRKRILWSSLTIRDGLNELPTTASATAVGFTPTPGQPVIVTLGSMNTLEREFGGTILRTTIAALTSDPRDTKIDCALIDFTWGLDAKKVSGYYTGSATAIAEALVATYAPGYTAVVQQGLPTVTGGITFTNQNLTACLSQLAKRIGSTWTCDYHKRVCMPARRPGETQPTILNAVHPTLQHFRYDRDLSQQVTRVYVEGGGVTAATTVAVGETILPLDGDPTWYDPAGGMVVSGPQRVAYTGVTPGAGGGLVGPGAAPSGAPTLALVSGVGVTPGVHSYAVTFTTASGESIAGPLATIATAVLEGPAAAPVAGTAQPGTGPAPGVHEYAVTFVSASGETGPGPRVAATTGTLAPPATAPTPGTPTAGAGPDPGSHDYAATFVTAIGETLPGPIGGGVLTSQAATPASGPTATATAGAGVDAGAHDYAVTWVTAAGESAAGPIGGAATLTGALVPPLGAPVLSLLPQGADNAAWRVGETVRYSVTYVTPSGGETTGGAVASILVNLAAPSPPNPPDAGRAIRVSNIPIAVDGAGTPLPGTKRIYRENPSLAGSAQRIAEGPNTATSIDDEGINGSWSTPPYGPVVIGPPPPTNTAAIAAVAVSGIPIGPTGVTARKLYRRSGGAGLRLVTTIANNTATTYTDTTANAGLGAAPPASSPLVCVVPLTAIPTGPAGVTGRKLYRRSGGAGLRLLATLANNTATTYTDTTPNASLGAAPPATATATIAQIPLTAIPVGGPLVTGRRLYGTAAGAAELRLVATLNATDPTYLVTILDAALGAAPPASSSARAEQIQLSSIPIGAPTVTSRKVYRTAAGAAQLRLLTTLANNTATTYLDTAADAALGANVPIADTSGLQQPQGNVLAGSTSLAIANIGPFPPAGGWAVIGNGQQVIRYTGVSGNVLTGIPATGPGAIVASIAFNSTVTSAPALNGIPASGAGSIRVAILNGADVNIWITVTDLEAVAARAALLGGDGIQEEYVQDRRLAKAEATARATAILAMKRTALETAHYSSRDLNTRGGRTVTINLGPPYDVRNVALLVQSVTETFPIVRGSLMPLFTVEASSVRLTFEEWLATVR